MLHWLGRRPRETSSEIEPLPTDARDETIESFDGTRLAYRVGGAGDRWLVIANGLGGAFCAWDDVLEPLAGRCRYLIWDYRGLHGSQRPADPGRFRIQDHCADLDCILAAEGIERMVLAGWSVGVQVALEHYRRRPETIEALALINGAHGRPLRRSTGSRLLRAVAPSVVRGLRAAAPVAGPIVLPVLRALAARRWSTGLLRRAGVINGEAASLTASIQAFLRLDFRVYTHMVLASDEHDTEDFLGDIEVPTVVVAGDRDAITRPDLARSAAARIPGCAYREVREATHYGIMEFPEIYARHLEELLEAVETPGS